MGSGSNLVCVSMAAFPFARLVCERLVEQGRGAVFMPLLWCAASSQRGAARKGRHSPFSPLKLQPAHIQLHTYFDKQSSGVLGSLQLFWKKI